MKINVMSLLFGHDEDSPDCTRAYHYLLIAPLVELLLAHGAKIPRWYGSETYNSLFITAGCISQVYKWKASRPGFLDSCNLFLDGLASMIRSFFLAETLIRDTNVLGDSDFSAEGFTYKFIDIVSYSSPSIEGSISSALLY